MGTDFFDDDLLEPDDDGKHPDQEDEPGREDGAVPATPVSDLNISLMVRHKGELSSQMAGATKEMEELRLRQETLQKERGTIEALAEKQDAYEEGKRKIMERLHRGAVLLEKEEANAERTAEVMAAARAQFKSVLAELKQIDEDSWAEDAIEGELDSALALVENATKVYRVARARIDSVAWNARPEDAGSGAGSTSASSPGRPPGFLYWLKVGIAVTLPLIAAATVFYIVHFYLTGMI